MKRIAAAALLTLALVAGGSEAVAAAAGAVERVPFSDVFTVAADGATVTPKMQVTINDATLAAGTTVEKGTKVGGVDLSSVVGKDLAIVRSPDGVELKGAWKK